MFRPSDYGRGSVDYMPWKLGDDESYDGYQPLSTPGHGKPLQKGDEQIGVQSGGVDPCIVECSQVGPTSANTENGISSSTLAPPAEADDTGGQRNVDGAAGLFEELGVNDTCSCADSSEREVQRSFSVGCVSARTESILESGEEVETALHGVLDALRKVREERLRLTRRSLCVGAPETNCK